MTDSVDNSGLGKWRIAGWSLVAILLAIPAIAGFPWTASDFVVAAVLLVGTGLAIEGLVRVSDNLAYRLGAALTVLSLLFLIWSNLAVGIVGSEDDPFNLVYFAIIPLVVVGALLSRLAPRGMSITLSLAALVPVGMAIAAFTLGKHLQPRDSVAEVIVVNALFLLLFGGAAALFRRADATGSSRERSGD